MSPRANFACKPCTVAAGNAVEVVHEDLPVASKACPITGKRRGFKRLFDGIQVSTTGHRVAKVLDPIMAPQLTELDKVNNRKAEYDAQIKEAQARSGLNRLMPEGPPLWQNAKAAVGMVDPMARQASQGNWPVFKGLNLRLRPE